MIRPHLLIWLLLLGSPNVFAEAQSKDDTLHMQETVISGNQELPKVLYILPWREMDDEPVSPQAPDFRFDRIMQPIYPGEYRRELKYRAMAQSVEQTKEK